MKVFATIDQGVIVSSSEISFLPNKNAKEYEIDHTGQLIIKDGKIKIDRTIPDPIKVYKQKMMDEGRLSQLNGVITDYVLNRELYNNGLIDNMNITEKEYKNILIEYKELKDKLL